MLGIEQSESSKDCRSGCSAFLQQQQTDEYPFVLQYRYGTGVGAMGALVIPLVAAFCCGATSVASNSRCAANLSLSGQYTQSPSI